MVSISYQLIELIVTLLCTYAHNNVNINICLYFIISYLMVSLGMVGSQGELNRIVMKH